MNRPNKIDALYDGLVVMYKAAGMSVKTVDPLPNQTLRTFKTRQSLNDKKFGRRLSEAAHSTPVLSSKRTSDGVVLFFQTVITSVGYSDVDGSVAAMKAKASSILKIQTRVFGASVDRDLL
jgi:hypothetical protein